MHNTRCLNFIFAAKSLRGAKGMQQRKDGGCVIASDIEERVTGVLNSRAAGKKLQRKERVKQRRM